MRLLKGTKALLTGFILGLIAATMYWFWQMPVRSERLMMTEIESILRFSAAMTAVWLVGYYVVPFVVRFAFMERFEFKSEQVPRSRQDMGRIKLLQGLVNDHLVKCAVELDQRFANERAITEQATSDREKTLRLLDQLNESKIWTGGASWNFYLDCLIAGCMGFMVWSSYRDYLPSGRVHRSVAVV